MPLVIAQFAARISFSGSSYQWASGWPIPKIGWWFGWLTFCYLASVWWRATMRWPAGTHATVRHGPDENTARMITLAVLLVQVVLAIASTRIVSLITRRR